jgi:hypothetical protein
MAHPAIMSRHEELLRRGESRGGRVEEGAREKDHRSVLLADAHNVGGDHPPLPVPTAGFVKAGHTRDR